MGSNKETSLRLQNAFTTNPPNSLITSRLDPASLTETGSPDPYLAFPQQKHKRKKRHRRAKKTIPYSFPLPLTDLSFLYIISLVGYLHFGRISFPGPIN